MEKNQMWKQKVIVTSILLVVMPSVHSYTVYSATDVERKPIYLIEKVDTVEKLDRYEMVDEKSKALLEESDKNLTTILPSDGKTLLKIIIKMKSNSDDGPVFPVFGGFSSNSNRMTKFAPDEDAQVIIVDENENKYTFRATISEILSMVNPPPKVKIFTMRGIRPQESWFQLFIYEIPNTAKMLKLQLGTTSVDLKVPTTSLPTSSSFPLSSKVKEPLGTEDQKQSVMLVDPGKEIGGKTSLAPFANQLKGSNEVRVRNPNAFAVATGLRSGDAGKDFEIAADGVTSVYVPDGKYDVYFVYSNKPEALFQGDSFTLNGNGIEIIIVKIKEGNYGIRQVK